MLEPLRGMLETKRIILASGSPCRKEIMDILNIPYETMTSNYPEDLLPSDFPTTDEFVIETAANKGLALLDKVGDFELMICADSVIKCQGQVFGKPKDLSDAKRMLQKMNNNIHQVYTGCCLFWGPKGNIDKFANVSHVTFSNVPQESIDGYLRTNEYVGKAGAYAIQGQGGTLVQKIDGDYYNIVGLPLNQMTTIILKHYHSSKS